MKIKPHENYRHVNFVHALEKEKIYDAEIASNQPLYKQRGLIFVSLGDDSGEILLDNTEYAVIVTP